MSEVKNGVVNNLTEKEIREFCGVTTSFCGSIYDNSKQLEFDFGEEECQNAQV